MNAAAGPSRPSRRGRPTRTDTHSVYAEDDRRLSVNSQYSTQSAPAAPAAQYHDVLLKTLSQAPKGSKMAEDAARAMLMAERERLTREQGRLRDKGKGKETLAPPEVPSREGSLTPTPPELRRNFTGPQSVAASEASEGIGNAFLSPSLDSPTTNPFEFDYSGSESGIDELTDLYLQLEPPQGTIDPRELLPVTSPMRGRPRHPALQGMLPPPPGPPPSIPLPETPHRRPTKTGLTSGVFGRMSLDQNALAIFWRGESPQMFGLVTYNDPQEGPVAFPVEVMGKTTQVIEVPPFWTGRVQKMPGRLDDPATHCELTFDGYAGMTFFRVSYVHGNNGPAIMRTRSGKMQSGSGFRALDVVPGTLCTLDSTGARVMQSMNRLFPSYRMDMQKFYRDFFEGPHQGQVNPDNNHALQMTHERQLLCEFF